MRKLQKFYKELGSFRQMAQDVLSIVNSRSASSALSIRSSTLNSFLTARDDFDQESAIYVEDPIIPKGGIDFLTKLPMELLIIIFSYLDIHDFLNCFLVSSLWHQTLNSPTGWRLMYQKRFDCRSPECTCSYVDIYRNCHLVEQNWINQNIKTHVLTGHQDSVYCAQLLDDVVLTGSRDNTIRVWNISGTLLKTINNHSASVLCLAADKELLVSGSSDSTCIVYSVPSYTELYTLRGHSAHVLDVRLTKDYILSCSKDWSIVAWHRETGELIWRVENAHRSAVNAMGTLGDMLFSAGGDGTIRQWNIHTGEPMGKFSGHTRGLVCLAVDKRQNRIISGGTDRSIRVWDLDSGECIMQLKGHTNLVRSLHMVRRNIVSASYDRTIRVWDTNGDCIAQYQGLHGSWIFCVCGNSKSIVSTSVGKKPVVLDFTTGVDSAVKPCIN